MKLFKKAVHYWFAIVSVVSFLVGWGMLAHSLKPIQPAWASNGNAANLPSLPPIQAFGNGNGGLNLSSSNNRSNFGSPFLRTGGS